MTMQISFESDSFSHCVKRIVEMHQTLVTDYDVLRAQYAELANESSRIPADRCSTEVFDLKAESVSRIAVSADVEKTAEHQSANEGIQSASEGIQSANDGVKFASEGIQSAAEQNVYQEKSTHFPRFQRQMFPKFGQRPSETHDSMSTPGGDDVDESRDLKLMFRHLCGKNTGIGKMRREISSGALESIWLNQISHGRSHGSSSSLGSEFGSISTSRTGFFKPSKDAIKKLTQGKTSLDYNAFEFLISSDDEDLRKAVGDKLFSVAQDLRDVLMMEATITLIAETTHVSKNDILARIIEKNTGHIVAVESIASVVILLNAIVMGVNNDFDSEWRGWTYVEWVFTLFFSIEVLLKLNISRRFFGGICTGLFNHFFGADGYWNTFDFFVVGFGVLDFFITAFFSEEESRLNQITLIRLAKLARLTRLFKVLRFRMFKNLLLLVSGAAGGFRILFWAMLLLIFVIYTFALFFSQTIGQDLKAINCSEPNTCGESEKVLENDTETLFSTVPRSMLTVFRCVVGDCTTSEGSPLPVHLSNTHGWYFIIPYVACLFFVTFGLFNLIMAVFVENTLEYAKQDDARRRELQHAERVRTAQQLEKLVVKFVMEVGSSELRSGQSPFFSGLLRSNKPDQQTYMRSIAITPEVFERVLQNRDVQAILHDMDVPTANKQKLFDAIDSDGSGAITIRELIDGLSKLRGPPDKTDIIGVHIATRSLQQSVRGIAHRLVKLYNRRDVRKQMRKKKRKRTPKRSSPTGSGELSRSIPNSRSSPDSGEDFQVEAPQTSAPGSRDSDERFAL